MDLTQITYLIVALVVALTLHEFAHALASTMLGDQTARAQGRLSINPLVHIDPFTTLLLPLLLIILQSPVIFGAAKPVPFNPWAVRYGRYGVALVATAGPAMNLVLAIFFALVLRFFGIPGELVGLFLLLITVNLAFMAFNILPIPPLDGSRILYAFSPIGMRNVLDKLETAGLPLIFILILLLAPVLMIYITFVVSAFLQLLVPGLTSLQL